MRVFLDANVLFSAGNAGSNIARLTEWLCQRDTAVSSDLAVEEARRNLELKRPQWLAGFDRVKAGLELVPAAQFTLPVPLDAKDVPLLCAAIAARCQYFATGDKRDFGFAPLPGGAAGRQAPVPLTLDRALRTARRGGRSGA